MTYFLGIDIGTSSAKAMVMDETGHCISSGSSSYDIQIPEPGYAEQDCQLLWEATCNAIRQAMSNCKAADNIGAIGVTGQMHGLVTLDSTLQPLRPSIIWMDQRSSTQIEALKNKGIEVRAGNPIASGFFLPSLLWLKQNEPQTFSRIHKTLLPKDYICYRLCGEIGTDHSDATGTLLYNLHLGDWDTQTLELCDISREMLPACHASCEIAGYTTGICMQETGLRIGIPVVYGGGDTPMQLVGNGIINTGQLNTNIGTAGQMNCICAGISTDRRLNVFHHIPQDKWIAAGASLNGGLVLKWLRSTFFSELHNFEDMDTYAAQSVAGANGLVLLPFLCGERTPYFDENAKGILFGMKLSHTGADVIRCAMESVVFSFRDCMRVFEELHIPLQNEIVASGGGAKSALWLQLQADILGKVIRISEEGEEASKGAAIAAGVGCGVYHSLEEGCAAATHLSSIAYEPNLQNRAVYEERFATYLALYQNNRALF